MYLASSSTTARAAADSSRRAAPAAEAAVGGGAGVARQAETRDRRDEGCLAPAAAGLTTGATARKDWSEFMVDSRWV
jgi:hypothetical protein